ncbi:hydroxyproline-rich glycoprotein family protein [Artemisia annua]|uniref:Hydroxyproline-rich glycoprotein family protein n=1 Tax=Artemisia annua TaxID=35608 RepID=A0A2U1M3E1_ARTAN|nr:hydroxyproline-rich glycoprotein family protein [Artemisia annua]
MEVVLRLVESSPSYNYEPPPQLQHYSSRPTLGFPLGTGLLLIIIFSLSGFFSCCYHWDKLRHLRGSIESDDSISKPKPDSTEKKHIENESLPVIMPGDRIAKFIALPCPCEPARLEKIVVKVVEKPPKPQHIVVPMY